MATFTNLSKNSATISNSAITMNITLATAGMWYGFGLFTYAGEEVLSTERPTISNSSKNLVSITNLNKS